jgi:hypothetical protein
MPDIYLRRRSISKSASRHLRKHASNVTSQFGEDGIIQAIIDIIGAKNNWCVEFGAWDGKYLSNTWTLLNDRNWSGVLIEGNADRVAKLEEAHRGGNVTVKNAFVGWSGDNTLDAILSDTAIPQDFDLLSIDIDGNDFHVWKEIRKYEPRIVVIEFNPTASNQLYFVQDPDPDINQGCSLLALIELGKLKGYELVCTTIINAFFVIKELFPLIGIDDNSIDAMHEEEITAEICHGYDGTVFAAGHTRLNWHGIALTQEDYQLLPKNMRKYPG